MNIFKTNKEYWNELLAKGKLFSHIKDGVPDTPLKKIVGFSYPIIMVSIALVSVVLLFFLPKDKLRIKTFAAAMVICSILGWVWGIWMLRIDPEFPGWLNAPWAIFGKEKFMVLEDWLFYPGCTALFYIIFRKVVSSPKLPSSPNLFTFILLFYLFVTLFFLIFSATAGKSIAMMFAVPGIILFILSRKYIDLKTFVIFQTVIVLFEVIWDLLAVSLIHYLPGFAWASQWIYITFDSAGNYTHSSIFLDYGMHRWAWLFMNPIEITPWFGIAGGLFNYALFTFLDTIFYKKAALSQNKPD